MSAGRQMTSKGDSEVSTIRTEGRGFGEADHRTRKLIIEISTFVGHTVRIRRQGRERGCRVRSPSSF